jgi:hypothetical protein
MKTNTSFILGLDFEWESNSGISFLHGLQVDWVKFKTRKEPSSRALTSLCMAKTFPLSNRVRGKFDISSWENKGKQNKKTNRKNWFINFKE